jgi:hypothetical protein
MKQMNKITRGEAVKLAGGLKAFEKVMQIIPVGYSGNILCLSNGVKLNVRNAHRGGRFTGYSIYGYSADGSDLQATLESLKPQVLKRFQLFWSPTGQMIGEVEAKSARSAIRKSPPPYRKYLGEIYAKAL